MSCNTKENTLKALRDLKVIDENNNVLDENLLSSKMDSWKKVAETKYKVYFEDPIYEIIEIVQKRTEKYGKLPSKIFKKIRLNDLFFIMLDNAVDYYNSLKELSDEEKSEQLRLEQEGIEYREEPPTIAEPEEPKVLIKPGVQELFESNETLANAVYEAFGIRNPSITVLPNGNLKIVAFRTEKVGYTSKGEYQRGKGLYLSLDKPYPGENVYTVEIEISPKNLLDRKLGFGEISEDYFIDEKNKRVDKQLDTLHEFKQSLGIKAEIGSIDGALMNELVLFDKELIDKALASKQVYNSQQKQQAQQLYSSYLDTIFPDSKVKDIVYRADKRINLNEQTTVDDYTQILVNGVFYSSNKDYALNYNKS